MHGAAKYLPKLCWPVLITGLLLLNACENDLKKVQELSADQVNMDVDTIHNVDIIFSDSAKVKFRILAPLLLQHQGKKPFNIMPKTVNVVIFDSKDQTQEGTLTADTGIQDDVNKKIEFHKNVVAKNAKGETFKSDELIWDQATKQMHSDKIVQIKMANGDIINGKGFQSNQTMSHWSIDQSTGIFNVTDAPTTTE